MINSFCFCLSLSRVIVFVPGIQTINAAQLTYNLDLVCSRNAHTPPDLYRLWVVCYIPNGTWECWSVMCQINVQVDWYSCLLVPTMICGYSRFFHLLHRYLLTPTHSFASRSALANPFSHRRYLTPNTFCISDQRIETHPTPSCGQNGRIDEITKYFL